MWQHIPTLLHAVIRNNGVVAIPRYRTVSLPALQWHLQRGGSCHDHTHWWKQKAQTHLFSSYRCLFNSCTGLLCAGFHIYPHTAWHIPSPSPPTACWFRSCLFLSGFHPEASVGDRIILRVVINCISYFLLFHLHRASHCLLGAFLVRSWSLIGSNS